MTTHGNDRPLEDDFPATLRMQLRGLRQDQEPRHDLWSGIAARIAADGTGPSSGQPDGSAHRRRAAFTWLASAASLAAAIAIGWQLQMPNHPTPRTDPGAGRPLLVRQADAMDREYQAALREAEAAHADAAGNPALDLLDRSAIEIRAALERDPQARFLLEALQHVYSRRLELTLRRLPVSP